MRRLDQIDLAILGHLQKNARLSNKELAAAVGLAPSSCLERVRRLEFEKVLRGYHAEVDKAALGIGLEALVSVRLNQHTRKEVDDFRNYVTALPMVLETYHVAGSTDFLLHVVVRDIHHLRDVVLSSFTTRKEVAHIETSIVFEHLANPALPNLKVDNE